MRAAKLKAKPAPADPIAAAVNALEREIARLSDIPPPRARPATFEEFATALRDRPVIQRLIERITERITRFDVEVLRRDAPAWLTPEEIERGSDLVRRLLFEHPGATSAQLLWMQAAETLQPRRPGRTARWSSVDGRELVEWVEAGLEAAELRRDRRKGVAQVIAMIRAGLPKQYGDHDPETLRKAYYKARRALSRKSA
jgi:hypothetical protein